MSRTGVPGISRLLDALDEGRTVLASSAQGAALVIDRIARHHLQAGRMVWPTPAVRDLSSWARERYEQGGSRPDALRVLEAVEERQIWLDLIADCTTGYDVNDPATAARAAQTAYRTMQEHGIPLDSVRAYPCAETDALLQWCAGFEERCRDLRVLPACRLLQDLPSSQPRPVPLDGIDWFPVAAQWLGINACAALPPVHSPTDTRPKEVRSCPTADAELVGCAGWLRDRRNADPQFRALIVVPDLATRRARVTDVFDAALEPGRFSLGQSQGAPSYAIAGGVPLSEFVPVRLALDATGAGFGNCSFSGFSALLRDPALQRSIPEADAAARVDRELRRCSRHEAPLEEWLRKCSSMSVNLGLPEPAAVGRLRAMREELNRHPGQAPMSHWAHVLIKAWEAGPWSGSAHWSSSAFQAAQRLRELLDELARASAAFGPRRLVDAMRIVSDAARYTDFQPQTGIAPVWITSRLFDPWVSFDAIWLAGADARSWPPPPRPVPMLPVQLQRQYGVVEASAAGQYLHAEQVTGRWQARCATLVFSSSTDDAGAAIQTHEPEDAGSESAVIAQAEPHWHELARGAPPLEAVSDAMGPEWDAASPIRGVHFLKSQSLCPFRGFSDSRFEAGPLLCPEPGFSAIERGEILHKALERLWGRLHSSDALHGMSEDQILEHVQSAVTSALEFQVRRRDPGPHWCRREFRRLVALLPRWLALEARRPAFVVESMEERRILSLGGIEVRLRIDRIDRLADDRRVLLDYKSGRVGSDWREDRPANPQLPAYASCAVESLAAVAYAQVRSSNCRFAGVAADGSILPSVNARFLESGSFDGQIALWRERLARIAQELREGVANVAPRGNACQSCCLQAVCRIDPACAAVSDEDVPVETG